MNTYLSYLIKKVIWVLPFYLFTFLSLPAQAQNYLDHLQQQKAGQGKVTVTQSPEITDLVNGKPQNEVTVARPNHKTIKRHKCP